MKRNLTCIVCPLGCDITVTLEGGSVTSISGNTCPRGAAYAESECTHPTRTLTTTVMCENSLPLPVKTSVPIPKDKIFECMKIINRTKASLPIYRGDVVIKNIAGCESDIIAVRDAE